MEWLLLGVVPFDLRHEEAAVDDWWRLGVARVEGLAVCCEGFLPDFRTRAWPVVRSWDPGFGADTDLLERTESEKFAGASPCSSSA